MFEVAEDGLLGREFWAQIMAVKNAVNKRIEEERNAGTIKGSLGTEISLYCDGALYDALTSLGDELRFVLITSEAKVFLSAEGEKHDAQVSDMEGLALSVVSATHDKCDRCWHHREDVGQSEKHPELCGRCIDNIDGNGETRKFA